MFNLDFEALGSVSRVTYRMSDGTSHVVTFDTHREALAFRGSCSMYIRRAIITDFAIECVSKQLV